MRLRCLGVREGEKSNVECLCGCGKEGGAVAVTHLKVASAWGIQSLPNLLASA